MKAITIRELHTRTGQWVRQAAQHGEIVVTDHGRAVAKIIPQTSPRETPYFARRTVSPQFRRLAASGKLRRGADSTATISADREDRSA